MVLKALILVGGFGTRLRPLTFTKAKPLVEFANKPIVAHQMEALAKAGVKVIILAVSTKTTEMEAELKALGSELGVEVVMSVETSPMGTAGPIALASELLDASDSDPFFMLNADVIANYNFKKLLNFFHICEHQESGCEGVIYVKNVEDPSRFGVVVSDKHSGQVIRFVEKPKTMDFGADINAGLYILSKDVIKRVPPKPTSIERVIFPALAVAGKLYRLRLDSFWADVGKPQDFLLGQEMYLNHMIIGKMSEESKEDIDDGDEDTADAMNIIGPVLIDSTARVHPDAVIGPHVVLGPGVEVGACVRIKESCIFAGSVVKRGAYISGSIVGWRSSVGSWARLTDLCNLGEDVTVANEVSLVGVTVCPHKKALADCYEKGTIIL